MKGDPLLAPIARYYAEKVAEHGTTARGVDWNSLESQLLRFSQLLQIVDTSAPYSILDYGCGYGALLDVLEPLDDGVEYIGYDIAPEMLTHARELHPRRAFIDDDSLLESADFVVASGIFNVKLTASEHEWRKHVSRMLDRLNSLARRGFAFNMLTRYSDPPKMRADLHYADPLEIFDRCKRRYSQHVTLLDDYGLWEFTVLVRREPRA